jgi:hypothetical protein
LLLEEEALLSQMNSTTNTDPEFFGKTKCKPGTIKKNADRIRQHTVALDEVNTQLSASPVNIFQGPSEDKKRACRQKEIPSDRTEKSARHHAQKSKS